MISLVTTDQGSQKAFLVHLDSITYAVLSRIPISHNRNYSYNLDKSLVIHTMDDSRVSVYDVMTGDCVLVLPGLRMNASFVVNTNDIVSANDNGEVSIHSLSGEKLSSFDVSQFSDNDRVYANSEHVVVVSHKCTIYTREGVIVGPPGGGSFVYEFICIEHELLLNHRTNTIIKFNGEPFDGLTEDSIIIGAAASEDLLVYCTRDECVVYSIPSRKTLNTLSISLLRTGYVGTDCRVRIDGAIVRVWDKRNRYTWNPFENTSHQTNTEYRLIWFIQDGRVYKATRTELVVDGEVVFGNGNIITDVSVSRSGVILL
jgi:hypothetical protein